MPTASELPIDTTATANQMAEAMFGNGISIQSASYTGAQASSGIYSDGDNTAPGVTPSDTGVILSTGRATSLTNSSGDVNAHSNTSSNMHTAGDSDLSQIAGGTTFDAAVFEAEFIPSGSTLTMQFTFSSEEYLEYVDAGFNDAVGVWVNGEKAELTIGDGDISIDNVNTGSNENLYIDNPQGDDLYNTEMDGFTVTLTLKAPVNPDEVNTIKIGIADAGDAIYDSNLLIAGDSIQTQLVAEDDEISVEEGSSQTLDVLANDDHAAGTTLTITEINGQAVVAGSTVTLADGGEITLNAVAP
ncbi:choice-of-anchor L domain-containing protein [Pseudophaeobacter leonis]|uniref:choice-of-anchor L domain-containing protein n=1 Tax=Pseudophaeobacter leonis TaxID=1144477 RepID=UPI0030C756F9